MHAIGFEEVRKFPLLILCLLLILLLDHRKRSPRMDVLTTPYAHPLNSSEFDKAVVKFMKDGTEQLLETKIP